MVVSRSSASFTVLVSAAFGLATVIASSVPSSAAADKDKAGKAATKSTKPKTSAGKAAAPAAAAPAAAPAATPTQAPADPTAPAAAATGTPAEASSDPGQKVKVHDLERRVDELKEQIFRSKARLNLLKEAVLGGVIAGSRAVIKHDNQMGSAFKLTRVVYAMDGTQIFAKAVPDAALNQNKIEIFNGGVVPGGHTLSVVLEYQGHGYGIFSYLQGYKFTVRSSHTFNAAEGKLTEVSVQAHEKGDVTTAFEDRPSVDFHVNVVTDRPATAEAR